MTSPISLQIVGSTAGRVVSQLRRDRRAMVMMLILPSLLLFVLNQMFDNQPTFNGVARRLLGVLPFTLMFIFSSVAMLKERRGGTLRRLLASPLSRVDLVLGYAIGFGAAAVAQSVITCTTAYWLLDLYTPAQPVVIGVIGVAGALVGVAVGLLCSSLAELHVVPLLPAIVLPQILLGGLFVPRDAMALWLERVSDALPLSYSIEALDEAGSTSLISDDLLGYLSVIAGAAVLTLFLAALTMRRRTGDLSAEARRRRRAVPLAVAVTAAVVTAVYLVDASRYVSTENAQVDGDRAPVLAPASGTLIDWRVAEGDTVRKNQVLGRVEMTGRFAKPQMVIRAPRDGTVVQNVGVEGTTVRTGTQLAVAFDLSESYVTARIDETDMRGVRVGQEVDLTLDSAERRTLTGYVREIDAGSSSELASTPPRNTSVNYERGTQRIPVRIAVIDWQGVAPVVGTNATVKIHRD
ncbi:ABC transporter permease [Pseudonocardia spinosispora]|uniref:ABC transporter permease n=1 Tax=Pseudonocardia spinosispora TaxID=103441 RepID=UPI00040B78F6|nr:ABC transporter permease [Pseudonocardia spinosispora]